MGFIDAITSPKGRNRKTTTSSDDDGGKEKMKFDLTKLPSEKDRKAILGCLSQVLSMMYSYENYNSNIDDQPETNNEQQQQEQQPSKSNRRFGKRRTSSRRSSSSDTEDSSGSNGSANRSKNSNNVTAAVDNVDTTSVRSPSISGSGSLMVHAASITSPSRIDPTDIPRSSSSDSLSMTPSSRHGTGDSESDLSSEQHEKRVLLFQKRCLKHAAKLLLLDEQYSIAFESTFEDKSIGCMDEVAQTKYIEPYLDSLSDGSSTGFQCLSMLLFRSLIVSGGSKGKDVNDTSTKSKEGTTDVVKDKDDDEDDNFGGVYGYDARIRRAYKILSHLILIKYYQEKSSDTMYSKDELYQLAARKFEALETDMGNRLVALAKFEQEQEDNDDNDDNEGNIRERERQLSTKDKWIRGMKVGGAGIAAGTLFAITGGLAAPAIAAGITSLAGGTALASIATVAVLALQSAAAVTTIFGVGGGGLAAVKMMRRTAGLEQFEIHNKTHKHYNNQQLTRHVCISGWIKDPYDFERPWGVTPTNLMNPKELLIRFYSVYEPNYTIKDINQILSDYYGKKNDLWKLLKEKYGSDPNTLLPLHGPRQDAFLDKTENEWIEEMVEGLGFHKFPKYKHETEAVRLTFTTDGTTSKEELAKQMKHAIKCGPPNQPPLPSPITVITKEENGSSSSDSSTTQQEEGSTTKENDTLEQQEEQKQQDIEQRQMCAWDFQANYTGELYTIRWESDLLLQIHNSVKDVARTWATDATKEALKQTMLAGLLTAVAIPSALIKVCNVIDGNWTMTLERADEAGKELAISLLESKSGNRPVTLVGYSFGARIVYSCLLELARHQELWETKQEEKKKEAMKKKQQQLSSESSTMGDKMEQMKKQAASKRQMMMSRRSSSSAAIDIHNYKPMEYKREPASIVEDAILMGSPISLNLKRWLVCRRIVAGRLINCYVPNDLMLRLMFRYQHITSIFSAPCGIVPIQIPGIENYNVTQYVGWHSDYCTSIRSILNLIGYGQARVCSTMESSSSSSQAALTTGNTHGTMTTTTTENNNEGNVNNGAVMIPGEHVKTKDMMVSPLKEEEEAIAANSSSASSSASSTKEKGGSATASTGNTSTSTVRRVPSPPPPPPTTVEE